MEDNYSLKCSAIHTCRYIYISAEEQGWKAARFSHLRIPLALGDSAGTQPVSLAPAPLRSSAAALQAPCPVLHAQLVYIKLSGFRAYMSVLRAHDP